jgi:hypothetical protein
LNCSKYAIQKEVVTTTYAKEEERAMKKVMLFIAAGIIAFCIVPIATTQAMPQQIQRDDSFASNNVLYVLNQKELRGMDMELNNPVLKDTILSYDLQEPHETTIAQNGKSTTTTSKGKTNPHVKRSGHGRSNMGDNATKKNSANDGDEIGGGIESGDDSAVENSANDGDEIGESEEFGDDSAIKYNKGLKNSSGYNKNL